MLKFDPKWRFQPPPDGDHLHGAVPKEIVREVDTLIGRIATQGNRWDIIEHFKGAFLRATGSSHVWSSNESWAESDLWSAMDRATENAPLFIEALYDACDELRAQGMATPEVEM